VTGMPALDQDEKDLDLRDTSWMMVSRQCFFSTNSVLLYIEC